MSDQPEEQPVVIPYESLSGDALNGILDDFILREGTDYGAVEYSLEEKREQVKELLKKGKAGIFFEAESETCTLRVR
jgi:uncharacterized protein YheU (UPF0270 family)